MIYFDSALIAKCYLNEPDAGPVRALARRSPGLASCELARLEFVCVLQRHLREGRITGPESLAIWEEFELDERDGVWHWFRVSTALVDESCRRVRHSPGPIFLRAADALHLACAAQNGFDAVYTTDRHMLGAAALFRLRGRNPADED